MDSWRSGGGGDGYGGGNRGRGQHGGGGGYRGGGGSRGGGQRGGGGGQHEGGGGRGGAGHGQRGRGGADSAGFRGRSRGGGGGGPPMFLSLPDPYQSYPPDKLNQQGKIGGWRHMPKEKSDVSIQKYTGKPASWAMNRISVSVNHFLIEPLARSGKPMFPIPTLYHYDINYEVVRERFNAQEGGGSSSAQGTPRKVPPKRKRLSEDPEPMRSLSQQLEESGLGENLKQEAAKNPPRKLPKYLTKAILDLLIPRIRKTYGHHGIATDGMFNLYTTKELGAIPIPMKHQVTFADLRMAKLFDEDDNATIFVTLTPSLTPEGRVHTIDTQDISRYFSAKGTLRGFGFTAEMRQTLEAACNAFVKSMPNFQYFSVGRSTMVPCDNKEICPLGGGLMAWKGLSANISMGWKPYLNVDIANCAFILNQKVPEVLKQVLRDPDAHGDVSRWSHRDFEEVRSLLKTCKVRYTISGLVRGGPIRDIPRDGARQITFMWEDEKRSKRISVFDYYRERYGMTLQFPNGPILELRKKGTYVPAELCTIKAGQSYNRKLDGNQTTQMLTFAKRTPQEKTRDINESMAGMKLAQNQVVQQLGIKVADQMLNIKDARVLVPPTLRFGPSREKNGATAFINPQGGTWDVWRQETDFGFYKGCTIKQWGVLVVGCPRVKEDEVIAFANCLTKNSDRKGVRFENKRPHPIKLDKTDRRNTSPEKNATDFGKFFTQDFRGCDLVLVVVPEKGNPLYGHIKHAAEVDVGKMTQCVIQKHVGRVNDSVVQNIILKINSKMGGVNHVTVKPILEPSKAEQFCTVLQDCPVMILGADVTHAPPGSKKVVNGKEFTMPSYAAVTGSLDPTCMPFMTEVRAQRKANAGAAEVIQDLEEIIFKMLMCYKATWSGHRMPCKIIYFRDGVGDGQFVELLHIEMNAIRRACKKIGTNYEPKITFITVQKRHKTRMFHQAGGGRIENVPAGTVVDTEIVHPTETDFYLCSHKGMMGTSRPSRYHVLWDDSEFSQDELQSLAYTLCYMYARCTKSVKMPAATYYAHLAADRAKKLCEGFETKLGEPTEENLNRMLKRSGLSKYPMHFV